MSDAFAEDEVWRKAYIEDLMLRVKGVIVGVKSAPADTRTKHQQTLSAKP